MARLQLNNVAKRYGNIEVLRNIQLDIADGEFIVLVGPSGCGKSTLLHLAGGLEAPSAGHVLVGGRDLATMSPAELAQLRRTAIGYVFQRLNLVAGLTAMENVTLPLELDGVRPVSYTHLTLPTIYTV